MERIEQVENLKPLEVLVKRLVFRGKEKMKALGLEINFKDCNVFVRIIDGDYYQIVLGDKVSGEEIGSFGLRESEHLLVGDFTSDYRITDVDINVIKSAAKED